MNYAIVFRLLGYILMIEGTLLLPPAVTDKLGAGLRRSAEATGNQIVILTVPSLEGESISCCSRR